MGVFLVRVESNKLTLTSTDTGSGTEGGGGICGVCFVGHRRGGKVPGRGLRDCRTNTESWVLDVVPA